MWKQDKDCAGGDALCMQITIARTDGNANCTKTAYWGNITNELNNCVNKLNIAVIKI